MVEPGIKYSGTGTVNSSFVTTDDPISECSWLMECFPCVQNIWKWLPWAGSWRVLAPIPVLLLAHILLPLPLPVCAVCQH